MKSLAVLAGLLFSSMSTAAPVDAQGTAVDTAAVQAAAVDKVPSCKTEALWDYCLQSENIWCSSGGVLQFASSAVESKCKGGCSCVIAGL